MSQKHSPQSTQSYTEERLGGFGLNDGCMADKAGYERAEVLIRNFRHDDAFGVARIQRKCLLGYNRASRVLEQLEMDGKIRRLEIEYIFVSTMDHQHD